MLFPSLQTRVYEHPIQFREIEIANAYQEF